MYVEFELYGGHVFTKRDSHPLYLEAYNIFHDLAKTWFEKFTSGGAFGEDFSASDFEFSYLTCRDNVWIMKEKNGRLYLEYSGSRHGFFSFTPFSLFQSYLSFGDNVLIVDFNIPEDDFGILKKIGYPDAVKVVFQFMLKEYDTSTPSEWNVKFYEWVMSGKEVLSWKRILEEDKYLASMLPKGVGKLLYETGVNEDDAVILTPFEPVETGYGFFHLLKSFRVSRVIRHGYKNVYGQKEY